jgi:hypothetical protein
VTIHKAIALREFKEATTTTVFAGDGEFIDGNKFGIFL